MGRLKLRGPGEKLERVGAGHGGSFPSRHRESLLEGVKPGTVWSDLGFQKAILTTVGSRGNRSRETRQTPVDVVQAGAGHGLVVVKVGHQSCWGQLRG